MDLDVAKSRASYYGASRLTKVYFSMPNIMFITPETGIQVPSTKTSNNEVEDNDRTQCSDAGHLCETAGYRCSNNAPGGNHEHGQTYKSRSFWKSTKKFFSDYCAASTIAVLPL